MKILALFCAFCMLNSCSSSQDDSAADESPAEEMITEFPETEAETEDLYADLRNVDGGGAAINMLLREEFTYEFMAEEETGEIINDTVYARNLAVEELLNISLAFNPVPGSFSNQAQFTGAFTASVQANDNSFNLVSCAANYMLPLTAQGYFRNLMNTPELSMDAPWYAQKYVESMTVKNRLYLTAGSASINLLENMGVLFFNKDLMADFGQENPYELVRTGNWTFDELKTLVENAYVDTNGNGEADDTDTLGYLTYGNMINAQIVSMGHAYIVRDEEGIPHFTKTLSERTIDVYNHVEAFLNQLDSTYFYNDTANDALKATANMLNIWGNGSVLFFPQVLSAASSMREDEFDFGVLPFPKFDSAQESYLTFILENVTVMGLPSYQIQPIAAQALEALSIYGYDTLSPAYYDVVLKDKYSRDEDTKNMLDIILAGVTFEYPLDTQFMANCIKNNSPLVSSFEAKQSSLEQRFDEIVNGWLALE